MRRFDVVIVGAGHGGAQAAVALRQNGFEGSIALVGKEALPPYERPPLSKEYLARDKTFDRIMIRPESFWASKEISLLLNCEVSVVDPSAQAITFTNGDQLTYGELIWSAGGAPRKLSCPGAGLLGVHAVRDKRDVDAIMHDLDGGPKRAVIIGGGYIGLEAAAVLTKLGHGVVVLEALDRVLARVAGKELSSFYEAEHRARGVDIKTSAEVTCLKGDEGRVTGVELADGSSLVADLVIAGIGVVPVVEPLIRAGAVGSNGVDVDEFCRTSLTNIFAIGDCAAHENRYANGQRIRLESVQNANDMATTVAKAICGTEVPYDAIPWFWSNQYDLKLQTIGMNTGYDTEILRGAPEEKSFSSIYIREGRVIALDCVNAIKDYVQGKKLIANGLPVDLAKLRDTNIPLKELV